MSIARDISRQTSIQTTTLTADQTSVTVTGGFNGSNIEVYLNGVRLVQGQDFTLNGTSGIVLTAGAAADDIIEFNIRNTSNSGFSSADTGQIVDGAITLDKLSDNATESLNTKTRVAQAWVNFNGQASNSPFTEDNGSIRSSLNVTSVTDNGTGDYTVNFTTPFASKNYAWAGSAGEGYDTTAINSTPAVFNVRSAVVNTDTFRFYCAYSTSSNFGKLDRECISILFFGELS